MSKTLTADKFIESLEIIEKTDLEFRCKDKGWQPYKLTLSQLLENYHKAKVESITDEEVDLIARIKLAPINSSIRVWHEIKKTLLNDIQ